MTDLTTRVRTALGGGWDADRSPWEGLVRLFEADADAFYLLACDGLEPAQAKGASDGSDDPALAPLSNLARRVRKAVHGSYHLTPPDGGAGHVVTPHDRIVVPADVFPRVKQFLMELDDKGVSQKPGKDYQGEAVSEAEVRFKLGAPDEKPQAEQRVQARLEARPLVFRLSPHDIDSLKTQPAYVSHNLLKCARKVVLAPTAIYRGLKRGEKAPKRLREGWAICGKPNRACDNEGRLVPPPPGMVFMVYADAERYVFDWDWVEENKHEPGHPLDVALRFGNPVPIESEMVLDLPTNPPTSDFDSAVVADSPRGDCVFCYLTDTTSYAGRINEDLTVFYDLEDREKITGFKIKNVHRILKEQHALNLGDAPGLKVLILPILERTLQEHHDVTIKLYKLLIAAWVDVKIPISAPAVDDSDLTAASC